MKKFKQRLSLFMTFLFLFTLVPAFRPIISKAADIGIVIDGQKDEAWNNCSVIGQAPDAGWQDFHINNLRLTNDASNLYFWIDAANVPNWGDNGQYIDIALNVNDRDSGQTANPWGSQFNFSGTSSKPNFHIVLRVKQDNQVNGAAVYDSSDFANPALATWGDLKGAAFAVDRTKGFEGKIPLNILNLKDGDVIKAIAVLSGNNSGEHGAFSVIPQDPGNKIAGSWNESANPNVMSTYSNPYTVRIVGEFTPNLYQITAPSQLISGDTAKLILKETTQDGNGSIVAPENANWSITDVNNNPTGIASIATDGTLTANNLTPGALVRQVKVTAERKTNPQDRISATVTIVRTQSPKLNNDGTVTFYAESNSPSMYLIGQMVNWDTNKQIPMAKDENGIYKVTIPLSAGSYEYKFKPNADNWDNSFTDQVNQAASNGNSVVIVPGLAITSPSTVNAGGSLPLTADLYNADGSRLQVTPSWSLKTQVSGVSINVDQLVTTSNADTSQTVTVIAAYQSFTAEKDIKILDAELKSPVINSDGTVTFNAIYNGPTLNLVGSMNGWNNTGISMTKNDKGVFSVTIPIGAGQYSYKFFPVSGSWDNGFTDTLNPLPLIDGNSIINVPGLQITSADSVKAGDTLTLTADLYDENGNKTAAAPVWTLKDPVNGVSIADNQLKIESSADTSKPVTVVAAQGTYTAQKNINILSVMYTYIINYYRPSRNYTGWSLWLWQTGKDGTDYSFNKNDSAESGFARAEYQFSTSSINFIVRDTNWGKDIGSDRTIEVRTGTSVEVWLVQGDPVVHYSRDEIDTSSRILSAQMDSPAEILVSASGKISDTELLTFKMNNTVSGTEVAVTASRINDYVVKLTVSDPASVDIRKSYAISSQTFAQGTVTMRHVLDDPKFYYSGNDLGLTCSETESTFKLWAPTALNVSVCLYDTAGIYGDDGTVADNVNDITSTEPMERAENGVWTAKVNGNLKNKYYMYKIEFANGKTNYAVDPYAKSVSANGQRTAIVDVDSISPEGWNAVPKPSLLKPTDSIIYELHIRDLSMSESSGMTNKGKFEAFTETGTTVPGTGVKTGIDSLKELGITHVHILPSYDYGSVNEKLNTPQFNWGYDPVNYNVPEGSYSSNADDPTARVREFKDMVQALHANGIRVIMDVVYNHTQKTGGTPFDAVVPGYYYRTDDQGRYTDGSGCGNEVASERPMVRKFIKDSVKYWATEYGVDGFRFDLMGIMDTETINQLTRELRNDVDPTIVIYGEPWTGGGTSLPANQQTLKGSQKDNGFAVFNDNFRGAIKGGSDDATKGFVTGAPNMEASIVRGVKGAIDDFTNGPSETINYITSHDNLNLWDKILTTEGLDPISPYASVDKNNLLGNESVKRDLLGSGIIFTSQGIPFFQEGDELLRSKFGTRNSYNSPDSINSINWQNKVEFKPVFDYYQGLIELRKTHPAFRMNTKAAIESNLQVYRQDGNIVIFELKNNANGDPWKNIVVIYNANAASQQVTLPGTADWKVVVDDTKAGTGIIRTLNNASTAEVSGLSVMVLYDQADEEYIQVPATIQVSETNIGINPGEYKFVPVTVVDQKGRAIQNAVVKWSSSDPAVASVDQTTGKIYGVSNGNAVITVECGTAKAEINITVVNLIPSNITISGADSVFATRNITLSANVIDQFGQAISNPTVEWSSSDKNIATVNAFGVVTGVNTGKVTITAKAGNVTTSKNIEVFAYVRKFVQFNYVRADRDYEGWNIWTWQTGMQDGEVDFTGVVNGIATVKFEIAPDAKSVGFVLRKGTDWSEKDAYSSDRYITIDSSMIVTKVTVTSGVGEFVTIPPVKGAVINPGSIIFTYRNGQLFENDLEGTLESVKVKVNGQVYDMVYDANNQYYTYTLNNAVPGIYEYSFIETNNGNTIEIPDPTNNVDGKSLIEYKKLDINVEASVTPGSIDSNQNAVISLALTGEDAKISSYREIYLDLSELGGPNKVNMDSSLLKQSIAVRDNVAAGVKNIPITVVDISGEKHAGAVSLTVKPVLQENTPLGFGFDESRVYFVVTDRFFNGDTSNDDPHNQNYDVNKPMTYHGGDLKGLTSKIDYLKELGINTIWITPIVEQTDFNQMFPDGSQYSYHGYWAKNFEVLDPHLGSIEDLKALIDKAHENGIKIMVDVVINHAGYGMKVADPRYSGVNNYPNDSDRTIFDGMFRDVSGNDPQTMEVSGLPDFKTEDPAVRAKLIAWQTAWIQNSTTSTGNTIDYFRIDTVKNVDNTSLKEFKNAITMIDQDFKVLGEYYNGDINNDGGQLNNGQMDGILDFQYKNLADNFVNGNISETESNLEGRAEKINNTSTLGQFLSSHDEAGFLTRANIAGNLGKLKVAASLQITDKGIPVIYYGEELGASGVNANDANRYDMPWNNLNNEADKNIHDHYQKLLNIRKNYSQIFAKGTRTKLAGSDGDKYLAFERAYNNESIVVALNIDSSQKNANIKTPYPANARVKDVYSGKYYRTDANQFVSIAVPSMNDGGTAILALSPVITLSGPSTVTVNVGENYKDPGAAASDNLTGLIVVESNVNTAKVGSYTVRYNVKDLYGNEAEEVIRIVNVVDRIAPVITLKGSDTVTVILGGTYKDAGAAANDNYDGNLTNLITVVNNVNTNWIGSYKVKYNVKDSSGNPAKEVVRTVNVIYNYSGLMQPIDNNGTSSFKAGAIVPVKFQLKNASGQYVKTALAKLYYSKVTSSGTGALTAAKSTGSLDIGNTFLYDSRTNQYIYNMSTYSMAPGIYMLSIVLDDGMTYKVKITIK